MSSIERIHAREVFDSRGRPTVEVEVTCRGSGTGRAIVPSGASTGRYEALELRDGDRERLDGRGVRRAVAAVVGEISAALIGFDASDQQSIDRRLCELDGTENKSRLGANALLGVSLAAAHAAANAQSTPLVQHLSHLWQQLQPGPAHAKTARLGTGLLLPLPMVNMISGGLHAGGNLDIQDVLAMPVGAGSYRQALQWVVNIYHQLGQLLRDAGVEGTLVGDEGGYGPRLDSHERAFEFVVAAIEKSGLHPGSDVALGLDVAAASFCQNSRYQLRSGEERSLDADEMTELLVGWVESYPIISIEDGLDEDDWPAWKKLTDRLSDRVQLIGDDLFVTNSTRLQRGIETGTANSILIKLNQIGTLWETLETIRLALDNGYRPVVSARSGETEDTTIAELAVATGAGQIKIGSVVRSERLAKYNQLLRLEETLSDEAAYAGPLVFAAAEDPR